MNSSLATRAIVEGSEISELDWDTYRTDRKDRSVESLTLLVSGDDTPRAEFQRGLGEGRIVAAAQNFARSLVNEPGNVLTPTELGARTKAMCRRGRTQVRDL